MNRKKEKMKKKKISSWLWFGSIFFVFFLTYSSFASKVSDNPIGEGIWILITGFIALKCGHQNSKWANKIEKSMNWAYVIGFMFSLIGLLVYYIYYKKKKE